MGSTCGFIDEGRWKRQLRDKRSGSNGTEFAKKRTNSNEELNSNESDLKHYTSSHTPVYEVVEGLHKHKHKRVKGTKVPTRLCKTNTLDYTTV